MLRHRTLLQPRPLLCACGASSCPRRLHLLLHGTEKPSRRVAKASTTKTLCCITACGTIVKDHALASCCVNRGDAWVLKLSEDLRPMTLTSASTSKGPEKEVQAMHWQGKTKTARSTHVDCRSENTTYKSVARSRFNVFNITVQLSYSKGLMQLDNSIPRPHVQDRKEPMQIHCLGVQGTES